jgi:hypothetical protein
VIIAGRARRAVASRPALAPGSILRRGALCRHPLTTALRRSSRPSPARYAVHPSSRWDNPPNAIHKTNLGWIAPRLLNEGARTLRLNHIGRTPQ